MNYGTSDTIEQKGWTIQMGPEFFQTQMGQRYYQKTMPDISQQLEKMNQNLEILADLLRQSLDIDKEIQHNKQKSADNW